MTSDISRVALVTGASRSAGLGVAIASALMRGGWDVGLTYWSPYDEALDGPGATPDGPAVVADLGAQLGRRTIAIEADLAELATPKRVFDEVESSLGPISGLVLNHCECVVTSLLDTSAELLQHHFAVNVMANHLLIGELARRFPGGRGRVVSMTSDHTIGNVPYGVTKGAADRISLAASAELGPMGITVNAVNPGPTDTGWMDDNIRAEVTSKTPLPRAGQPGDAANLVAFLFSDEGGWVTGQLLYSNGGFGTTIP